YQRIPGPRRGGEQVVREVVGEDAIDLLRHPAIVGAESRLDMTDRDAELMGRECRRQYRVGVTLDQHDVGALSLEQRRHAVHDLPDLIDLGSRADFEIVVRIREPELLEEHPVHRERVVLAGVDDPVAYLELDAGADDRRHLDDLGPSPHHDCDHHVDEGGAGPWYSIAPRSTRARRAEIRAGVERVNWSIRRRA